MKTWHFPSTPWGDRVVNQCVDFPAGLFDDAFDVCSLFGRVVNEAHPAIASADPQEKQDGWTTTASGEANWRVV